MPFQHGTQPELTFATAVDRTFGPTSGYDSMAWAGDDGRPVIGAIGVAAVQTEGGLVGWHDAEALRHTILAVRHGRQGDLLTVAQHYSLPNGERPPRRRVPTQYRLGAAVYDRLSGAWASDPGKYDQSALWQTLSLSDMTDGLAVLTGPDARNPRSDPIAYLQLQRIMSNLCHRNGFNFREPLIKYLVSRTLADMAPLDIAY